MHSRIIKLVSPSEVEIQRNNYPGNSSYFKICHADELHINDEVIQESWDRLGSEAKNLAETCWRQTGSFADLSDESAVPFVGKVMKVHGYNGNFVVQGLGKDHAAVVRVDGDVRLYCNVDQLLPLTPPAPKIRPYNQEEIFKHLGRRFKSSRVCDSGDDELRRVDLVGSDKFYTQFGGPWTCQELLNQCTWADDGSPCGIVE